MNFQKIFLFALASAAQGCGMFGSELEKCHEKSEYQDAQPGPRLRVPGNLESLPPDAPRGKPVLARQVPEKLRRSGRVVEGARLEFVYALIAYRGFESHLLRQICVYLNARLLVAA